ncbi:MAG: SDR family oxidoreductase [Desulfobacteraceae bacterium]|jgi:NAD(P)-dependent dehydrogenase (short-subunit alcohol dehydrogenase family)
MDLNKTIRVYKNGVAIVTGGASGIGRAISEVLVKRGCQVVIVDLQGDLAEEVASKLRLSNGKASAVKADVTNYPAMERLIRETVERLGRIDYIFNNAGIGIGGHVNHFDIEDWKYIVNVNLMGVINGVQAVYKVMIDQGFGHIVNTASIAGLMPSPGMVGYSTTKYAVVGLSESLRSEAARFGVRVSVLCPGVIRTPILAGGGKFGRMLVDIPSETVSRMWESLKPMPPAQFAEKALDALARNKDVIVVPSWWKRFWWINRLAPSLGLTLSQKRFEANLRAFSAGQAKAGIGVSE